MKVQKLVKKLYQSIFDHDQTKEKKMWFKVLRKSINHKKTHAIK